MSIFRLFCSGVALRSKKSETWMGLSLGQRNEADSRCDHHSRLGFRGTFTIGNNSLSVIVIIFGDRTERPCPPKIYVLL